MSMSKITSFDRLLQTHNLENIVFDKRERKPLNQFKPIESFAPKKKIVKKLSTADKAKNNARKLLLSQGEKGIFKQGKKSQKLF